MQHITKQLEQTTATFSEGWGIFICHSLYVPDRKPVTKEEKVTFPTINILSIKKKNRRNLWEHLPAELCGMFPVVWSGIIFIHNSWNCWINLKKYIWNIFIILSVPQYFQFWCIPLCLSFNYSASSTKNLRW